MSCFNRVPAGIPRYDAVAKVTGKAQYGADVALVDPVYAFLVTSSIAKGRIDGFDLTVAKQVRGVVDIVTHENAEKLKEAKRLMEADDIELWCGERLVIRLSSTLPEPPQ